MGFLQKIIAIWRNVSVVQRALLVAITLTIIAGGWILFHWAGKPQMRLLYRDLDPEQAAKITDIISEHDIPYELKNGGTSIYVPEKNVYELRLEIAKQGLPESSQKGFKIFDESKIGVSPKIQQVNLLRALQDELAKSIQMIDGIEYARVHIVKPQSSIFSNSKTHTSASVALKIRPGYELPPSSIAAITHLVAGAVESLEPKNVTVIDSNGRLLSRNSDSSLQTGAATVAEYRERIEHNLAKKAEDMLLTVLGPGRATVKVSAEIDMTSLNLVTEKYDPKGVPTKEEIESTIETKTSTEEEQQTPASKKSGETTVTEYVVGKTVEQKTILPGTIKSLTVAAFVDLTPDNADPNNPESAKPIVELSEVEQVIKNALGLKDTDSLKVVQVRFNRPKIELTEPTPSNWPRYLAIAKQLSLAIAAICALLALKIFGSAAKKTDQQLPAAPSLELPAGEQPAQLAPGQYALPEPVILRKQIASALQNNPDQVKRLFASWVEENQ